MWHFERVLDGRFRGAFYHPYFLRDNKVLCSKMSRHLLDQPSPRERGDLDLKNAVWTSFSESGSDKDFCQTKVDRNQKNYGDRSLSFFLDDIGGKEQQEERGQPHQTNHMIARNFFPLVKHSAKQQHKLISNSSELDGIKIVSSRQSSTANSVSNSWIDTFIDIFSDQNEKESSDLRNISCSSTSSPTSSTQHQNHYQEVLNDGDLATFAGRNFFILDDQASPQASHPTTTISKDSTDDKSVRSRWKMELPHCKRTNGTPVNVLTAAPCPSLSKKPSSSSSPRIPSAGSNQLLSVVNTTAGGTLADYPRSLLNF